MVKILKIEILTLPLNVNHVIIRSCLSSWHIQNHAVKWKVFELRRASDMDTIVGNVPKRIYFFVFLTSFIPLAYGLKGFRAKQFC